MVDFYFIKLKKLQHTISSLIFIKEMFLWHIQEVFFLNLDCCIWMYWAVSDFGRYLKKIGRIPNDLRDKFLHWCKIKNIQSFSKCSILIKIGFILLLLPFKKRRVLNVVWFRSDTVAVQLSRYTDRDVKPYFKNNALMCNNQTLYFWQLIFFSFS